MARWRSRGRGLLADVAVYAADFAIFALLFLAYIRVRHLLPEQAGAARDNAQAVVQIEQALGIYWEPGWQGWALDYGWLIDIAGVIYIYGHQWLLPFAGLLIFLDSHENYRQARNAMLISLLLALPTFYVLPVAPPRLLESTGMIDTVSELVRSTPYAAIPSYHYGWNAFVVAIAWITFPSWWVRLPAVAFSALMWWSIVVTGNHFFLDMIIGALYMVPSFVLAIGIDRWFAAHPRWERRLTRRVRGHRLPL